LVLSFLPFSALDSDAIFDGGRENGVEGMMRREQAKEKKKVLRNFFRVDGMRKKIKREKQSIYFSLVEAKRGIDLTFARDC